MRHTTADNPQPSTSMLPTDPLVVYRQWYRINAPLSFSGMNIAQISSVIRDRTERMNNNERKTYNAAIDKIRKLLLPCRACQDLHRRVLALCHLIDGWDSYAIEIMVETICRQHRTKASQESAGKQAPIYAFLASEIKIIYESIGVQWIKCEPDSRSYVELSRIRKQTAKDEISRLKKIIDNDNERIECRQEASRQAKQKYGVDLPVRPKRAVR